MKIAKLIMIIGACSTILALSASSGHAVTQYGDKGDANWPSSWTPVTSLNDGANGGGTSDFVGDSTNPGAYYASDNSYIYFRLRVAADTNTFNNSIFVMIDNDVDKRPNYSFTWDARSNDVTKHGLELQIPNTIGLTWATSDWKDIDGKPSEKVSPDFALPPGTDGYVRTLNNQSEVFGYKTTFVDFAISTNFLSHNTTFNPQNPFNWAGASVPNANDHALLTGDITGNASSSDLVSQGWSNSGSGGGGSGVPEPSCVAASILASIVMAGYRRMKKFILRR